MKPAIASMLVDLFTVPGAAVLDPFSGCGTIPFEGCLQGRRGIALDLSPLAFCLSAAKVNVPSEDEAKTLLSELGDYLAKGTPGREDGVEQEIIDFYHPDTLAEVLLAKRFFGEREVLGVAGPAHWFVKACVLHILHGNRPYALSRRSHGIIPIPPKGETIYKPLMRSLEDKVARMELRRARPRYMAGETYEASAINLPLPDRSVDTIITSPPFLGTTEFLRQNRVRLWFSGWSYRKQREVKAGSAFVEQQRSLAVYDVILAEFRRVLARSGLVILHVGVVKNTDMGQVVAGFARHLGYEVLAILYEDARSFESHGRTDRGATNTHQFLFLRGPA